MSQNFSQMSEIYIPELMELDSYWQKAVEDAICDTLKGEKRLCYALKNRKKIKQKLEMLGLKAEEKLSFSALSKNMAGCPNLGDTSASSSDRSFSSRDALSRPEMDPEGRTKSPDRPLLGNGSLEKMKKSQNSFNCEPMGFVDVESDSYEDMDSNDISFGNDENEQNKKVKWLHVRKDSDFVYSDSESANNLRANEDYAEGNEFQKCSTGKDMNYFIKKLRLRLAEVAAEEADIAKAPDSLWDTYSHEIIAENPDLERRLQVALAKRDILNENLKPGGADRSDSKGTEDRRKRKGPLSPFIKFYLEVYRELCQKRSAKEIAQEANRRWWNMSLEQRSTYCDPAAQE